MDSIGAESGFGRDVVLDDNSRYDAEVLKGSEYNSDKLLDPRYIYDVASTNGSIGYSKDDDSSDFSWMVASGPLADLNFGDNDWELDKIGMEQVLPEPPSVFQAGNHVEPGDLLEIFNSDRHFDLTNMSFNQGDLPLNWVPGAFDNTMDSMSSLLQSGISPSVKSINGTLETR